MLTNLGEIAHRLLKNSVPAHEYILFTETAKNDLQLPLDLFREGDEAYGAIGTVKTFAFLPPETAAWWVACQ